MRILNVRLKNLNSLAGEWEIDLTHPAFADGLFAITGPTGAGKTTVLDAVCLALYGRTPRLARVAKSGNEILSRRTGECFAEVTFETASGRYRCHWSQRRAHKSPDGELQNPRHEIADADSGEILESKVRDVAGLIESATGMDFDRFTRSMMLAQGGFAAFLQAAPDERAPILEQITGTEIYSRISIRVHERQREERDRLSLLRAEAAGIAVLEPEREWALKEELRSGQDEEAHLADEAAGTEKAIAWLAAVEGLRRELLALDEEEAVLQGELDAFVPDRERLGRSLRAGSLEGAHAALAAVRREQADDREALRACEEGLPALEASAMEGAGALEAAERNVVRAKEALRAAAPILQRVRALDHRRAERRRIVSEAETDCAREAEAIEAEDRALLRDRRQHAEAVEALERVDAYLREHARDEGLVGALAGVEEQLDGLVRQQKESLRRESARERAASVLEGASRTRDDLRERTLSRRRELDEASERLRKGQADLDRLLGDRLLREYRAEKETLLRERAFRMRIAELEAYRDRLEDGKPCPLCGAAEHPYAKGNVPAPDEIDRRLGELTRFIHEAEGREAAVRVLGEAENAARQSLTEAEGREASAERDVENARKVLAEASEGLETLRTEFAEHRAAALERLRALDVAEFSAEEPSLLLGSLRARLGAWQEQARRRTDAERRVVGLESEMRRREAVLETRGAALSERREELEDMRRELDALDAERGALCGDGDPDAEELALNAAISEAEGAEAGARERRNALRERWNASRSHAAALAERIARRDPELGRLESDFLSRLEPLGFADEEEFLEAGLPAERREALAARAGELEARRTGLRARRRDREERLDAEAARRVTDLSREELELRLKEREASLRAVRERVAGLRHRLAENAAAGERLRERAAEVEAQRKECRRWEELHELIGSADGKKYRNFAQGLTFDLLIGHANRQLRRMTDRYLLVRDDAQPLELNVIDDYQAGEVRSAKNLSGGESFIVSLSLALGLSHMASWNVRVDSLFLDEGFGTLDEDALDTALDALASLRRDGKLIGVISHVPALKERIGVQIRVEPGTGGRSRLLGPGCRAVGVRDGGTEAAGSDEL